MSHGPDTIPDWQLERLRLGELAPADQEPLTAAVAESEVLRGRLAELDRSDAEILAAYPPKLVAAAIRARAATTRRRSSHAQRALVLSATAFSLALAFWVWPRVSRGPATVGTPTERTRVKGLQPHLALYRQTASGPVPLGDGSLARTHDLVQVTYVAAGSRYGVVVSLDGRGAVTVHLPAGNGSAAELAADGPVPLGSAYELDDAPGFERFFLVTSQEPFQVGAVTNAVRRLAAPAANATTPPHLDLPSSFTQWTIVLRKDGSR